MSKTSPPPQHPLNVVDITAIQSNTQKFKRVHRVLGIILGITCGLAGFTSFIGIIYYLIAMLIANCIFTLVSTSSSSKSQGSQRTMIFNGITDEIWSFFFFWTLFYNIARVY